MGKDKRRFFHHDLEVSIRLVYAGLVAAIAGPVPIVAVGKFKEYRSWKAVDTWRGDR
jgi:hypothetical protein